MAIIGTFIAHKDGGWFGSIQTLGIQLHRVRFIPNDNRSSDKAPDFLLRAGQCELGAAWFSERRGKDQKRFLRVQLDCPTLPQPVSAALFEGIGGEKAQLVWNRRT